MVLDKKKLTWRSRVWMVGLAGTLFLGAAAGQAKQPKPPKHVVELEIEESSGHPFDSNDPADFPLVARSGWTLTLYARGGIGFAGYGKPSEYPNYPQMDTTHPWVFGNPDYGMDDARYLFGPDGCPSWVDAQIPDFWDSCDDEAPWPVDEILMPFTPGINEVEECPPIGLPEDCEGYLTLQAMNWQDASEIVDARVGPYLGTAFDDYGFGSNWRFPGLVITADAGVGVVLEAEAPFDRTGEYRNLAGFVQAVSYLLANKRDVAEVSARMVVPDGLFTPLCM